MAGLDNNTKLLLHCDGADQATSFPDESNGNHTVTAGNQAQVDTAAKKWGTGSLLLDGTGDYLSIPDSADWDLVGSNTDSWTIDFWVKHDDHVGNEVYLSQTETVNVDGWRLYHEHGAGIKLYVKSGSVTVITFTAGEITDTDPHHVALCKVGSKYGIYIDGTQSGYVDDSDTDTFAGKLGIGVLEVEGNNYDPLDGWMDEIRIQKSNYFGAAPNDTPDDTITVPVEAYSRVPSGGAHGYFQV